MITNPKLKCKENNMDREYDYVTFLIKHKELFTFDKEQKIFYDKNYELAIGKKAELIEALRKFLSIEMMNILLQTLITVWGCSFFLLRNF